MPVCPPAIYLHVGPAKTGTTYLQDVLWRNRPRLLELGVTFPGHRLTDHFQAALDLRDIQFGGYDDPQVKGAWRRLVKAIIAAPTPRVVVSHEIFGGSDDRQTARLARDLAGRELHLVFGARDVARQLPAVWQESLKNRKSRSFEQFLATTIRHRDDPPPGRGFWRAQRVEQTLRRWSAVIPPERIHVVTLPHNAAAPDTLWRRFAAALDIPADGFDLAVARANHSLSPEHAEVLRQINRALPDQLEWPEYQRLVKHTFNELANRDRGLATAKVLVPEQYRDLLTGWAAETRAALVAMGCHIIGDLDDLLPSQAAFGADAEVRPDKVTEAAVELLVAALTSQPSRRTRDPRDRAKALVGQIRKGRGQS